MEVEREQSRVKRTLCIGLNAYVEMSKTSKLEDNGREKEAFLPWSCKHLGDVLIEMLEAR